MSNNKFHLDLWGGEHYIDKENNVYHLKRDFGIFTNLCVMMYGIVKFTLNEHKPEGLSLNMITYDYNKDFYKDLYYVSNEEFSLSDITDNEIRDFLTYCEPNMMGLGRKKSDINFKILNKVLKKYFNLNDIVKEFIKDIEKKHNINYEKTLFIWARKTDKYLDNDVPEVDTYINLIKSFDLKDYEIIVQTDDLRVYNEFKEKGLKFKTLDEIPYAKDVNNGFHTRLCDINDEKFYEIYNMSKVYYLQRIIALVHVASKCDKIIIYPGNLRSYIPIIRGNWYNVYSFNNKNDLIDN